MKALVCPNCGGDEFVEKDGYRICRYCKSKLVISKEDRPAATATIALNDDVAMLLDKCKSDPARARKYASLALEMDPSCEEALNILFSR